MVARSLRLCCDDSHAWIAPACGCLRPPTFATLSSSMKVNLPRHERATSSGVRVSFIAGCLIQDLYSSSLFLKRAVVGLFCTRTAYGQSSGITSSRL